MEEIQAYIQTHLNAPLTLEELAAVGGYSPFHFHRKFKAATGMAPRAYVMLQRFNAAAYLLAITNIPVAEVMTMVGMNSKATFSTYFKRHFGCSPTLFRRQWKNTPRAGSYLSLHPEREFVRAFSVLGFPTAGDYFNPSLYTIWNQVGTTSFHQLSSGYYGVYHQCQLAHQGDVSRYDAALHLDQWPAGVHRSRQIEVPEGWYLVFSFVHQDGSFKELADQVNAYLSQHKLYHGTGLSFFKYDQPPWEAPVQRVRWYVPLQGRQHVP